MVSLWNGYRTWTMQSVLSELEQDGKVKQLNAALGAEDVVADILKKAGYAVYMRKRVFVAQDNHNREIDVVAIGDHILVVEVKNWSGSVWKNENRWFQLPFKAQRPLEFEDIASEARYKAEALRRHLENDHKISMDDTAVVPVLVFTNPTVKLDPNSVGRMPNVFTVKTLRAKYNIPEPDSNNSGSSWSAWAWHILPNPVGWLIPSRDRTALSQDVRDRVEQALGKVRTWDTVTLHNGTLMHGDVVGIDCPNASAVYQRHHIVNITLNWCAPSMMGLVGSLWNGTAGTVKVELATQKRQGKKHEKKPRDEEGNLVFPIVMPKRKTDMRFLDRILLKRAGSPNVEPVLITAIRSIELSQHRQAEPALEQCR